MISSPFKEKTTGISPFSSKLNKEGSLSYFFNLHPEGYLSPPYHTKHTSSPASKPWKPSLDAADDDTPLSWLSTLLSRRKTTDHREPSPSPSPHAYNKNESKYDPFSASWEPPRASSWEQLSSWQKPSSSLWNLFAAEPSRASDVDIGELRAAEAAVEQSPLPGKERKGQLQWVKSLLAVKWAIKLRRGLRKKHVSEHGRGDGDDEGMGRACSQIGIAFSNHQIKDGQDGAFHSHSQSQSSHYNPLLETYGSLKHNTSNKMRVSHHNRGSEHTLLRFYLTPIKIGSKRPRGHCPLSHDTK